MIPLCMSREESRPRRAAAAAAFRSCRSACDSGIVGIPEECAAQQGNDVSAAALRLRNLECNADAAVIDYHLH